MERPATKVATPVSLLPDAVNYFQQKIIGYNDIICDTAGANIFVSLDNGNEWLEWVEPVKVATPVCLFDTNPAEPYIKKQVIMIDDIFCATQDAKIHVSTDNGSTWDWLDGRGSGTAEDPYLVRDVADLLAINDEPTAHFKQVKDIDLAGINWTPLCPEIGFGGVYNGQNFEIKNLTMTNRNIQDSGLFSSIILATLKNLKISGSISTDNTVQSSVFAGIVASKINKSIIKNVHASGEVSLFSGNAGGFAEFILESDVEYCSFIGSVITDNKASGFCVYFITLINGIGTIKDCFILADVTTIRNNGSVGGFIYSTKIAFGHPTTLTNCYCAGKVRNTHPSPINKPAGFIVDNDNAVITDCLWDATLNPDADNPDPAGVTGLTTTEMQDPENYEENYPNWDFDETWNPPTGGAYPTLREMSE